MDMRFVWPACPKALAENIVKGEKFRFTLLSDGLLRLEYDEKGQFEDRATRRVLNRDFPRTAFECRSEGEWLTLETERFCLRYRAEQPFAADTLSLCLKTVPYTQWSFGEPLSNLKGTARTLDSTDGSVELEEGVCSRDGIALLDDSEGFALGYVSDEAPFWPCLRVEEIVLYLFAFGHDYRDAVKALYRLSGTPPLLPAYALGNWWSRYHQYTQEEYLGLMKRFEEERLPFSVAVIDMDWHHVHDLPEDAAWPGMDGDIGWTGYSWNRELFPDPDAFLSELHAKGLRTTLNLHPAQGVRYFEDMYTAFAEKRGIDPATKAPVKLDILNPDFMKDYFDVLHHPMEKKGVDFWWMDWQQGTDYWWIHDEEHPADPLEEKVDPLWMLNHLHILDFKSKSSARPMFFSRYAGWGSHRYPIGFSGDSAISWASLKLQPRFTATASNIGYCWWSHDIGGHLGGCRDGELSTRWLQLGVFSPILRLHSSRSQFIGKEPWKFRKDYELAQGEFLRLRARLFPYLYTMNYRTYSEGEPLVQPMYYAFPERYEAYEVPNQFLFGTQMLVAPITDASDAGTDMGRAEVWLPEGSWFDFFTGLRYESDGREKRTTYRFIDEYPVFCRTGAIVPMQEDTGFGAPVKSDSVTVTVFPGADGQFTLYEDSGDGDAYAGGAFVKTKLSLSWGDRPVFSVSPAEGDASLMRPRRLRILLRGLSAKAALAASSQPCQSQRYDFDTQTLMLDFGMLLPEQGLSFELCGDGELLTKNEQAIDRAERILTMGSAANNWKDQVWKSLTENRRHYTNNADASTWHLLQATREMFLLGDLNR